MAHLIDTNIRRPDAGSKSGGTEQYIDDMSLPDMIYARTVTSGRARADIVSITLPGIPEGYAVIDRRDVPGTNRVDKSDGDWPILAEDRVNYIGEPVLIVAGPDRQVIETIMAGIEIEYRDIPALFTMEESESASAPPIFGEDNLFADYSITKGDPDRAFEEAVEIFEGTYRTGAQEQAYMETQGMIGCIGNGIVTVYGSMQCPYYVHHALMHCFGVSEKGVRVVQASTGGAFGGKEDYPSLIACHAALAARVTGRPVKIVYNRSEDILITPKRHPSRTVIRTALGKNGDILGHHIDITLDGGAYSGLSAVVLQRSLFASCGVYSVDHLRLRGRALATNNTPKGAFRGFGAPQSFFAMENHMERLALHLGRDPAEFKARHFLKQGDTTVTGGTIRHPVLLPEMTRHILEVSGYREKRKTYGSTGCSRGIGITFVYHGCGFTGSGEQDIIKGRVKLLKRPDGTVDILAANTEMGQGFETTARKIVAQTLNVPLEKVRYEHPDTSRVPDSGPTAASRSVMVVGGLLARAAEDLAKLMDTPGEQLVERVYEQPADVRWNQETFEGDAYPAYSWGVVALEADVDPVTFEIRPEHVWAAFDVGKTIDERIVTGQAEGGLVQSLGWGSTEVLQEQSGDLLQGNFTDYIIPTSVDVPIIDTFFFDNPYENGPFGAKGAGELTFIGGAPVLVSAVRHALGGDFTRIPLSPEYLEELCR